VPTKELKVREPLPPHEIAWPSIRTEHGESLDGRDDQREAGRASLVEGPAAALGSPLARFSGRATGLHAICVRFFNETNG
jgi:hypothetical protein